MIVSNLQKHVSGEREMTATQIQAAKILLAKVVPDVSSVSITGEDGGPVKLDATVSPSEAYLRLLGK
jgi:hypothetical protein